MASLNRAALLLAAAVCLHAAEPLSGRWEGTFRLPARECPIVIDLDPAVQGQWIGSVIFPTLGVKGAALSDLAVKDSTVSFTVKGALGGLKISGTLGSGGALTGTLEEGGNTAPLSLARTGPPQVDLPRHSTTIAHDMEGVWEGDMFFVDHNVHVRLTLANNPDGRASAKFLLKGRREVPLDVAMVTQESNLLTLEIPDAFLIYDGRFQNGEIRGLWQQGPYELPLVLHTAKP